MEISQIKNLVILMGINDRAAIAILRALKGKNIEIFLAFGGKQFLNFKYKAYQKNRVFYYDSNNEEDFVYSLIEITRFIKPYILLPIGEIFLRWSLKHKSELCERGVNIPTVDIETYEKISDKLSFTNLCKQFGFNIPTIIENIDLSSLPVKFVVKPNKLETGSENTLRYPLLVENKKSYQNFIKQNLDKKKYFIQEYITGPSIYYCGHYLKGVKLLSFAQMNLHQQPNGKSVIKSIPYELPKDFILKIDTMVQSLNWDGVMMIEFKRQAASGKYYAIECNPRFWGPLQLCIDNGVNFPASLLRLGNPSNLTQKHYGYIWLAGYLSGLIIKQKTSANFQLYKKPTGQKIYYRDIWLRSDTLSLFFCEFIYESYLFFLSLLKLTKFVKLKKPLNKSFD